MTDLYSSLFNEEPDHDFNIALDIINETQGHADFDQNCKYYDLLAFNRALRNNPNNLTIIHLNARSISNKFNMITALLQSFHKKPSVIVVTETWLTNLNCDLYKFKGYTPYHLVRSMREHGGVSIYVLEKIQSNQIMKASFINDEIEINSIKIMYEAKTYVVCGIYRPQTKHEHVDIFNEVLLNLLNEKCLKKENIILIGDLNINLLEHASHQPTGNFLTSLQSINFYPYISRPTRFPDENQSGSPSLLDHIFINFINGFLPGIIHFPVSDHLPVFVQIATSFVTNKVYKVKTRILNEVNKRKLNDKMRNADWEAELSTGNINEDFNKFEYLCNSMYNECFPIKYKNVSEKRLKTPWISQAVLNSIKRKNKLFKYFKIGAISSHEYKKYRNELNNIINLAKKNYYISYFTDYKNNTKIIWDKIKELKNQTRAKVGTESFKLGNKIITDKQEIANSFNRYYINITPSLDKSLPTTAINPISYLHGDYPHSMTVPLCTVNDILNIIKSLKNKGNPIDGITASIIKENRIQFAIPLAKLFNLSVSQGIFPDSLKHAVVTPIYKKGPKCEITNYRPISGLKVYSKIFESQMKKHLVSYLDLNNIICKEQFGFRKNMSTFDALNRVTDKLFSTLDNKMIALCIMVDFTKAFDTVRHDILLNKLQFYGIRGCVLRWFASYLDNRYQKVKYDNTTSEKAKITYGVPQGSILGPILFLIFINDLPKIFSSLISTLFADDATLISIGDDMNQLIYKTNKEIHKFYMWATANRLIVNLDKTIFLVVTNKKLSYYPPLFYNFDAIKCVKKHKLLGVIIDNQLTFKDHVDQVHRKLSQSISIIHNLREYMPEFVLKTIYLAHIEPHINYCVAIWGGTYLTYIQSLFLLQKRAIRIITKKPFLEHSRPLFKQMNILNIYDMIKLRISEYVYRNLNSNIFQRLRHQHNTRGRDGLIIPVHALDTFKRSLAYSGPKIWNNIPEEIKNKTTLSGFKSALKRELLSKY